jgi:hypothetical protein
MKSPRGFEYSHTSQNGDNDEYKFVGRNSSTGELVKIFWTEEKLNTWLEIKTLLSEFDEVKNTLNKSSFDVLLYHIQQARRKWVQTPPQIEWWIDDLMNEVYTNRVQEWIDAIKNDPCGTSFSILATKILDANQQWVDITMLTEQLSDDDKANIEQSSQWEYYLEDWEVLFS